MDIISSLPPEVSQKIILFLSVRDLFNCMTVCRYWRQLINCDYIWSHYFKILDIDIIEGENAVVPALNEKNGGELPPLCSLATELRNYLLSPADKWKNYEFKHTSINLKYRQYRIASYKTYLAIMYLEVNELHTFHVLRNGVMSCEIIYVGLPKNSVDQPLRMNSKYIVLGAYNITLVYKLNGTHFSLFKAFALKYDPVLHVATEDFDNFVKDYMLLNHSIFERTLVDDILWITDATGNKHIIDLATGKTDIFSTLLLYTKVFPKSKFVVNHVDVNVSITDLCGRSISSFSVMHSEQIFFINDSILCICLPMHLSGREFDRTYPIECRKIYTGDLIRVLEVPERTRITLHPSRDHVLSVSNFCRARRQQIYCVMSTCILSGTVLWKYEVESGPNMFWGSFLSVISGRYLLVYPGSSNDEHFALFTFKGRLIYEDVLTSGIVINFSEYLVVTREEGRIFIMY